MVGRILLVAAAGGVAIGGASGSTVGPVLGPAVAGVLGLVTGLVTGGLTAVITTLMGRRHPQPPARTARLWFLLPTMCVATLTIAVSGWLLGAGWWSGEDVAPLVAFGLTGPLALLLGRAAASWCLNPVFRHMYRADAGRTILLTGGLVACLVAGALMMRFFRS